MTQTPETRPDTPLTYRPGTVADSYAVFVVFEESLADLSRRLGSTTPTSISDPAALAEMWAERRPLYEHLAETAHAFWVAEREGQVIGFARSIINDGVWELTEIFIRPGQQSGGMGRELLSRVLPQEPVNFRSIVASADYRAQALYLKLGLYPRFPLYYFGRKPEATEVTSDLAFEPVNASPQTLESLARLDLELLGFRRDISHRWLLAERQGYLYYRQGRPVGYGYAGLRNGPFALLDNRDFPAVLAHAENEAARHGRDHFGVEVPTINKPAVDHLIGRGFRIDSFITIYMSDKPFGQFENYILTSPPFFL